MKRYRTPSFFLWALYGAVIFSVSSTTSFAAPRSVPFSVGETLDPGAEAVEPCGPTDANCFPAVLITADEGVTLLTNTTQINFVGAGVTTASSTGGLLTVTIPGGAGSPEGLDTQIQFNDAGSFGGDAGLTYNKTTDRLTIVNASSTNLSVASLFALGGDTFTDLTGTGLTNTAGVLSTTLGTNITAGEIADGDHGFFSYVSGVASLDAGGLTSANLLSALTDETGTGNAVFSASPAFTGTPTFANLYVTPTGTTTLGYASTTALTVSGNSYFGSNVRIGTTTVQATFAVQGSGTTNLFTVASSTGSSLLTLDARGVLTFGSTTTSNILINGGSTSSDPFLGVRNIALGTEAFSNYASGATYNTAIGYQALYGSSSVPMTGDYNTAIGINVLRSNTTGSYNTAIGSNVLTSNVSGFNNTAFGQSAMVDNVSGSSNIAIGPSALRKNTTGSNNIALGGIQPLWSNTTGSNNIALGYNALLFSVIGSDNIALGYQALFNATGTQNIAIGSNSGDTVTTGNSNTLFGYNSDVSTSGLSTSTAIGAGAIVGCSNCLVLGGTGANYANIGIGTTTPSRLLTVQGGDFYLGGNMTATGTFAVSGLATLGYASTTGFTATNLAISSLRDSTGSLGTSGYVLQSNGSTAQWVATSSLGITGGGGLTSSDIDTSAKLAAILTDETGLSSVVFSSSPTLTGTVNAQALTLSSALTLSGSSANIALGSNYLSGDGADEGIYVNSLGRVGVGTSTPGHALEIHGVTRSISTLTSSIVLSNQNQSSFSTLSSTNGYDGYINAIGGIGTGGTDSIFGAQRITNTGNLRNIGSIQAGALDLSTGGTFATKVDYTTAGRNQFVAMGDLNGDNNPDVVAVNTGSSSVSVFFNNGDGTFATKVDYTTGTSPYSVAIGDLNGDSRLDIVSANNGGDSISILFNNGDGTFATNVDYASGSGISVNPRGVDIGDFNGDGRMDIVSANYGQNSLSVFLNNGSGTFASAVNYNTASSPYAVAVGDVNGDGRPDLVSANFGAASVSVLLNNGNGTFATKVDYTTGSSPASVAIGDLNGDGKADIAASTVGTASVAVFINNGNGTFAARVDYTTGTQPYSVAINDVNGDGHQDLVTANFGATSASIFTNNGNGTFATKVDYATGISPISVAVGDVNRDGRVDLIVANYGVAARSFSVLLNNKQATLVSNVSGFLGVGYDSPSQRLDVRDSQASGYVVSIRNTANTSGPSGIYLAAGVDGINSGAALIQFVSPNGTGLGSITQTGASTVSYNTSSDLRIKENISTTTRGLETLLQIPIYDFNFITDLEKERQQGYLAQELYLLSPEAVHVGGESATTSPWAVDYGRLTPLIVRSVQELDIKIEDLATTTVFSEIDADSYVGRFYSELKNKFIAWFESASNGIGDLFANRIRTKEICVGDESGEVCVTKPQLEALLIESGQESTSPANPETPSENEETPPPVVEPQDHEELPLAEETQNDEELPSPEEPQEETIEETDPVEETPADEVVVTPEDTEEEPLPEFRPEESLEPTTDSESEATVLPIE